MPKKNLSKNLKVPQEKIILEDFSYSEENLGEILARSRENAGFTLEEFSRESRIPLHHIQALENNDFGRLPPDIYIRGMIKKYAGYFRLDEDKLMEIFEKSKLGATSGSKDKLPENRFAAPLRIKFNWQKIRFQPALLLAVIALSYILFQARVFLQAPTIILESPDRDLTVSSLTIAVQGRVLGASKVTINGQDFNLSRRGNFQVDLMLEEGLNSIDVSSRNFLGKERRIARYVFFKPESTPSPSPPYLTPSPEIPYYEGMP